MAPPSPRVSPSRPHLGAFTPCRTAGWMSHRLRHPPVLRHPGCCHPIHVSDAPRRQPPENARPVARYRASYTRLGRTYLRRAGRPMEVGGRLCLPLAILTAWTAVAVTIHPPGRRAAPDQPCYGWPRRKFARSLTPGRTAPTRGGWTAWTAFQPCPALGPLAVLHPYHGWSGAPDAGSFAPPPGISAAWARLRPWRPPLCASLDGWRGIAQTRPAILRGVSELAPASRHPSTFGGASPHRPMAGGSPRLTASLGGLGFAPTGLSGLWAPLASCRNHETLRQSPPGTNGHCDQNHNRSDRGHAPS